MLQALVSETREKPVSKGTGQAGYLRSRMMWWLDWVSGVTHTLGTLGRNLVQSVPASVEMTYRGNPLSLGQHRVTYGRGRRVQDQKNV